MIDRKKQCGVRCAGCGKTGTRWKVPTRRQLHQRIKEVSFNLNAAFSSALGTKHFALNSSFSVHEKGATICY